MKTQSYQPGGSGLNNISNSFPISGTLKSGDEIASTFTARITISVPTKEEVNQDIATLVEAGWSVGEIFSTEGEVEHSLQTSFESLHARAEEVRAKAKTA